MSTARRVFGSSWLWGCLISVIPMALLVIFITIVNNQKANEETFRTENVLLHSTAVVAGNINTFFRTKLAYMRGMNNIVGFGIWADDSRLERFTHFTLPMLESHIPFRGVLWHNSDSSFYAAVRAEPGSSRVHVTSNPLPYSSWNSRTVIRRHRTPITSTYAADISTNLYTRFSYIRHNNPPSPKTGGAGSWVHIGNTLGSKFFGKADLGLSTSEWQLMSYVSKASLPQSLRRGLKNDRTFVARATLRAERLEAILKLLPSTMEALIVRTGTRRHVLLDTRNISSTLVGQELTVDDPMFGALVNDITLRVSNNLANSTVSFDFNGRSVKVTRISVDRVPDGTYALLTADSARLSLLANNVNQAVVAMGRVLSLLPHATEGLLNLVRSRTLNDLGDVGDVSRMLVPYYQGVMDTVQSIYICEIDNEAANRVLGAVVPFEMPCYQLSSPGPNFVDVTWWAGDGYKYGRGYDLEHNDIEDWSYLPAVTSSGVEGTPLGRPFPADHSSLVTIYPRISAPFSYKGEMMMTLPYCFFWPRPPHNVSITDSESCVRFMFEIQELRNVLIDAYVTKNGGGAALVTETGDIIASTVDSHAINDNIIGLNLTIGGQTFSRTEFESLKASRGSPMYLDESIGLFVAMPEVYSAHGEASTAGNEDIRTIYVLMVATEEVGEADVKVNRQVYNLDGLVGIALLFFIMHLTHFLVQVKAIRQVRKVLIQTASLKLSEEEEKDIRRKTCYSNYDLDSLQEHAFSVAYEINRHRSLIPRTASLVIQNSDSAVTGGLTLETKKALAFRMVEKPIVMVNLYTPSLKLLNGDALKEMQRLSSAVGGIWHRLVPLSTPVESAPSPSLPTNTAAPPTMNASWYWPSDNESDRNSAWSSAQSCLKMLGQQTNSSGLVCLVTVVTGPALVGNLGPKRTGDITQSHFKQFSISGLAVDQSTKMFRSFIEHPSSSTSGSDSTKLKGAIMIDQATRGSLQQREGLHFSIPPFHSDSLLWTL